MELRKALVKIALRLKLEGTKEGYPTLESRTQQLNTFTLLYDALVDFLNFEEALFLQRLHYWLQNENAGYILKDGSKWIFNGYREWSEQLRWLSPEQIGKAVRALEKTGWLITSRFYTLKREIGFAGNTPSFHEDNQRKWYQINYQKIFEDTGFDLLSAGPNLYPSPSGDKQQSKRSPRANGVKIKKAIPTENISHSGKPPESSIKENQSLYQRPGTDLEREPEGNPETPPKPPQPEGVDQVEEIKEAESNSPKTPQEGKSSAAAKKGFSKKEKNNPEEKEIWEIAPGKPYPVFLNWWADRKYKPQGGKWELDARGNAYSEFYNNRTKTTVVIFPEFLEYMQRVAENCNQQLANGIKAILPSCFMEHPDASPENVLQVMQNLQQLVAAGVQVALPTNSPTPSCSQSISFENASSAKVKPLPQLEKPSIPSSAAETDREKLMRDLARNQSTWRNAPLARGIVKEWASSTPGVVMTIDGPVLANETEDFWGSACQPATDTR